MALQTLGIVLLGPLLTNLKATEVGTLELPRTTNPSSSSSPPVGSSLSSSTPFDSLPPPPPFLILSNWVWRAAIWVCAFFHRSYSTAKCRITSVFHSAADDLLTCRDAFISDISFICIIVFCFSFNILEAREFTSICSFSKSAFNFLRISCNEQ